MTDNYLEVNEWDTYFAPGEMAERSNAAVLKTVEAQVSGGSNPSLSAHDRTFKTRKLNVCGFFIDLELKNK